jgi:hypothetical protein
VDALKKSCPAFALVRSLAMQFRGILRSGSVEGLIEWMAEAKNRGIYSLKRFAKTLRRDWNAVQNSLSGGRPHQPAENAQAADVWSRRLRIASRSSAPLYCSLANSRCTKAESDPYIDGPVVTYGG